MAQISKGVKTDDKTWKLLDAQAKLVKRSRNNLINLVFYRVCKMSEGELLTFLHPREFPPVPPSE